MMVDVRSINLDDFYVGKDYNATFQLLDGTTPVDITGYTNIKISAKQRGTTTLVLDDVALTISVAASGKFTLNLSTTQTGAFTAGTVYEYQIVATSLAGEQEMYVTGAIIPKEVL